MNDPFLPLVTIHFILSLDRILICLTDGIHQDKSSQYIHSVFSGPNIGHSPNPNFLDIFTKLPGKKPKPNFRQ